jgi:uncharacterized protein (DUF427 family)
MPADKSSGITIAAGPPRVRVRFAGRIIADSRGALVLHEANYAPVLYLPRKDVDMSALATSTHTSHCPHKGDARYWSIRSGDRESADAAWCYEVPLAAVAAIAGHAAFYPDRVDAIETEA